MSEGFAVRFVRAFTIEIDPRPSCVDAFLIRPCTAEQQWRIVTTFARRITT